MPVRNPWEGTQTTPEQRWHEWFAWFPVKVPVKPGYVAITLFETVWRREVNGKWEYKLRD